jgi:hypothetical protein
MLMSTEFAKPGKQCRFAVWWSIGQDRKEEKKIQFEIPVKNDSKDFARSSTWTET